MFNPSNRLRHFDGFSIDLEKKILWFGDERPDVPSKAVEVLCALAERNGEVMTREALLECVWHDAFVEEGVLTQNVYVLRKFFREHGISSGLIETVPRRGYRLHAEPHETSGEFETVTIERSFVSQAHLTEVDLDNALPATAKTGSFKYAGVLATGILIVFAVTIAAAFYQFSSGESPAPDQRILVRYEALSPSGRALYTGLSNTGEYAAYVLHTDENKYSLMLHHIPSKSDVEILAPQEMHLYSVQFAPDGNWIYFGGAKGDERPAVHRMPVFGGSPEAITRRPVHHFSISPDGARMAMYRRAPKERSHYLEVCKIAEPDDCVQVVRLTGGSGFKIWGTAPSWSADGKKLLAAVFAPAGEDARGRQYLAEVDAAGGELREIKSPAWYAVHQAYWSRDGKFIYAMVRENAGDQVQLWRLEQVTGTAVRLTNDADDYREFRASADGSFLVANTWRRAENLFVVSLEKPSEVRQLSFDDSASNGAVALKWSPATDEIIYSRADDRSVRNLWRMDLKTRRTAQVTFDQSAGAGSADTALDGKTVFFESDRSGSVQIWRSNLDGTGLEQITNGAVAAEPEVSPDGKWLYYSQEGAWKMSLEDGGRLKVLDRPTGVIRVSPREPDLIAVSYFDETERAGSQWKLGIFREGQNDPITVIRSRAVTFDWKRDGSGLYFIDNGETFSNVWFQPLDGGEPTRVTNFSDQKISNFSVSADGRSMVLSRGVSTSRILKIDLIG